MLQPYRQHACWDRATSSFRVKSESKIMTSTEVTAYPSPPPCLPSRKQLQGHGRIGHNIHCFAKSTKGPRITTCSNNASVIIIISSSSTTGNFQLEVAIYGLAGNPRRHGSNLASNRTVFYIGTPAMPPPSRPTDSRLSVCDRMIMTISATFRFVYVLHAPLHTLRPIKPRSWW